MKIKIIAIALPLVLLSSFWIVIPLSALETLFIDYPSTIESEDFFVMEGKDFLVMVSADGLPIPDATVTFAGQTHYTNEVGVAFAKAPIGQTGKLSMSVGKEGYQGRVANIGVRHEGSADPDEQLVINIPEFTRSGEGVIITITTAEGAPVDDAEVVVEWSNDIMYTNGGVTRFTTPSVDTVQTYAIQACKDNYYHDIAWILIYPAGTPELVIETPSKSIYEEQNIEITVTDGEEQINAVEITVEWNDETYITENGCVHIRAPPVDETTEFTINASLEGYIPATTTITVMDTLYWLEMTVPTEVMEGEHFQVIVTVNSTSGASSLIVPGIMVTFLGITYPTENGMVRLTAPLVDYDREYQITASHPEYTSDQATILVRNSGLTFLTIDTCASVNENTSFIVNITANGHPIEQALVTFNEENKVTDQNGQVEFISPQVDEDTNTEINASKQGYHYALSSILVVNLDVTPGKEPGEDINRTLITEAIQNGNIGAEITFQKEAEQIKITKIIHANITVNSSILGEENTIALVVNGDEEIGKTIFLTINDDILPLRDIVVKYDGVQINEADTLIDVLNANDDGALPEYFIVNQSTLLISVPRFSEHQIIVSSISEAIEAVGGVTMVIMYITIIAIVGLLYIVPILYFQKK
ncbi:MAG: hypothetical protein V1726_07330 [Methanobacteriota archaeon]